MEDFARRVSYYDHKIFGAINAYWAAAAKFVHAREFLAELLGTFVLVVSLSICMHGVRHSLMGFYIAEY